MRKEEASIIPFFIGQNPIDSHPNSQTLFKSAFFTVFPGFDINNAIGRERFALEKFVMVALHGSTEKPTATDATPSPIIIVFASRCTTNSTHRFCGCGL